MDTNSTRRSKPVWLMVGGIFAVILLATTCSAGFIAGRMIPLPGDHPLVSLSDVQESGGAPAAEMQEATPVELQELFGAFWQTWNLVHDQYVEQPVDDELLMRGAIKGMLDSLGDEHTTYLEPEQFKMLNTQLQGEESYEGIGAWVDTSGDYLTVISPMPGSPAEDAGLRTGDKIIKVDGEDMTGIDGEVVRKKVIGPAGSTVLLTIARVGIEPFDVEVKRGSITVPSVEARMLENDIAYVRLYIFADNTKEQLRSSLEMLLAENPKSLILDLRNNGGGYLESAVDVASEFIGEGVILYEEYGDGTRITYDAREGGLALDIPMVILINEGSASASEIVAGALQDLARGKLVGVTSFGKGSVQVPTTLQDEQGAVRITIARWLTPNERAIHGIGLTPDVVVEITEEDITANRDPQLDKAVELLMNP